MSKQDNSAILFLYEGDTERDFYNELFEKIGLAGMAQIKKSSLKGNTGLNIRVAKKIDAYLENSANAGIEYLSVFVAYDREGDRSYGSRINKGLIANEVASKRLKAIHEIIATQMLESWFLIDIDGIYKHLDMPENKREPHRYKDYEKFTWEHLHEIFKLKDKNKKYHKGAGCIDLIKALDLMKIHDNCADLKDGMSKLMQTAGIKTRK